VIVPSRLIAVGEAFLDVRGYPRTVVAEAIRIERGQH